MSVTTLRDAGVTVLDPDAITERDENGLAIFAWTRILERLEDIK
ncbi:hypothetical protein [Actinophytocola sp.]|nr:hypothetical protein [Actinophytocola sp.]